MTIERAKPSDSGCWVDGHWGQYAIASMIDKADDWGWAESTHILDIAMRHLSSMGPSDSEGITDDEHEQLSDASDSVEQWLNANVAPEGYLFHWSDGEFFLSPWCGMPWGEPCEDETCYCHCE